MTVLTLPEVESVPVLMREIRVILRWTFDRSAAEMLEEIKSRSKLRSTRTYPYTGEPWDDVVVLNQCWMRLQAAMEGES